MGAGDHTGLSELPAVHELASKLGDAPHALAVTAARQAIESEAPRSRPAPRARET